MRQAKLEFRRAFRTTGGIKMYEWDHVSGIFTYNGTISVPGSTFTYPAEQFWKMGVR